MTVMDLQPPTRRVPDPEGDWKGADLTDEDRVDDDFIAEHSRKTYPPLQPEDEKLF